METWWEGLTIMNKVVMVIALISSLIFLIQTVLTFVGMDSGGDFDADFDGDMDADTPFQLFSFRNLINFLLGFSWSIIALQGLISNTIVLVLVAALIGAALVAGVMYMMFFMMKLQQSGTMKIEEAVGKNAVVYLSIPANKTGVGKVHVKLQKTLRELDAITSGEEIETGAMVVVSDVYENTILIVHKI